MNLFDGANRNVEKHSTGMNAKFNKYGKKVFDLPDKNEVVEEQVTAKIIQGPETQKPELSEGEKSYRETRIQNAINSNNKAVVLKDMRNNILDDVFENVMADIYYNALYLDDDFKEFNSSIITESVHKFLDEKGGYKYLVDGYNRTKSPLLKSIMDICEESAAEIADRKIKECNDKEKDLNDIKIFNMTNDEKNNLDYNKDSIGIDQISNKIKDKILDVVKDEKKREAEHEELMEEIENQLSDDPEVNDEKTVTEALNKIFISNVNIEEGTLFNSLLRNNYKGVLESGYDALDLSKINNQEDIYNILDEISLENLLLDAEENNDKDELVTEEMQNIFNKFIEELDRQNDLEEKNIDAVIEAFNLCEEQFFDVANSKITKQDLLDLRHDFRVLQEAFDDFIVVEEGAVEIAKKAGLTVKNGVLKIDEKFYTMCYKFILKTYKLPSALEREIQDCEDAIEYAETELKRRKNLDDGIFKKIMKSLGRVGVLCIPYIGQYLNAAYDSAQLTLILKAGIRYNKIFLKVAKKRLEEMRSKVSSVNESFDYNEINPDIINEIAEECAELADEINNEFEITEEAKNDTKEEENKKKDKSSCTKEGKDCDKSSCTKEGKDCDKSSCTKEGKDCNTKKIDTEFDSDKMKKTVVKESIGDILEECVNIIDKKLDLHEKSNTNMANEVCENYMGSTVLIPIMNKKDAGLEGLDLPYKMKHVLESLTVIMDDSNNKDAVNTVKKAVKTNKTNVSAILESFKAIPSTPVYKMNYFNTFNDLLDILDSNLNEMSEVFESISINEYDDVTDDLNIYENDYEYDVITESINDIDKLATDEVECIDMDFILADTIAKYTLMETMYTLQLEDYKYDDIKKMTTNMLNKK